MNKAVLVIDMPKSCDECQLKVLDCDLYYTTYACQNKRSLCLTDNKSIMISQPSIYESGWNACLEELLGEE